MSAYDYAAWLDRETYLHEQSFAAGGTLCVLNLKHAWIHDASLTKKRLPVGVVVMGPDTHY